MSKERRPVTLFTGQWADLPFEEICRVAAEMGYDGLELACWGDHFDVNQAVDPKQGTKYCKSRWDTLSKHGLTAYAISSHLVGQGTCDVIDERHAAILGALFVAGDPDATRKNCVDTMIKTGHAARALMDAKPQQGGNDWGRRLARVNGFTGSSIWNMIYPFPPTTQKEHIEVGYRKFGTTWLPILEEFQSLDVVFALEVHPGEIAFDTASARRALRAVGDHKCFGFNYDPSHLGWQLVDYVRFINVFSDRIFHVHMKDVAWGTGDGESGIFGSHSDFGAPGRWWDFKSVGRGMINFTAIIEALNHANYSGPLSVEWEHAGMDRKDGAREACAKVRTLDFLPSGGLFDEAFKQK